MGRTKILQKRKAEIIYKYHQGVPVWKIATDEHVSNVCVYKYLLLWGVREKREKVVSEGDRERRKSTILLPFEKRVSSELLAKMKENTRINKQYSSKYPK